jgi:hypothetical protein
VLWSKNEENMKNEPNKLKPITKRNKNKSKEICDHLPEAPAHAHTHAATIPVMTGTLT